MNRRQFLHYSASAFAVAATTGLPLAGCGRGKMAGMMVNSRIPA